MSASLPLPSKMPTAILKVDALTLVERGRARADAADRPPRPLVDALSFTLHKGEHVAVIGGSGAGKTLSALAIAGALPGNIRVVGGQIESAPSLAMAMVFQDARGALNPVRRIGAQFDDVLSVASVPRNKRREQALAFLHAVGLADPDQCYNRYAFELSGGMCQRVLIALALARRPGLLIADEPTTGLDAENKNAVLDLLLNGANGSHALDAPAVLMITHDVPMAVARCSRILVMHQGRLVESANAKDFIATAAHPYSRALINASPQFAQNLNELNAKNVGDDAGHERDARHA